jgi:hypothetical protein
MNTIKRYAGIIWIILGPIAIHYLLQTAGSEIAKKPGLDTQIQWGVFVTVFYPIAIGFILFGLYALEGNYDHIPEVSSELTDYESKPL